MYQNLADMTNDELWQLMQETRSVEVRNEICVRNMALSHYVAQRFQSRAPEHQSMDDIISYAYEGLLDSIEKYNPDMGFKFVTYAFRRISGAILDGIRKEDPLPRSARKRVKDYEAAYAVLHDMEGIAPTDKELATVLGISEQDLGKIQRDSQSQPQFLEGEDLPESQDTRYEDPELNSELLDLAKHIANSLSNMSEPERNFVQAHYGSGLTLGELSDILDSNEGKLAQLRRSVVDSIVERR